MEEERNPEKQMAEESDTEEDETSPARWFQMVIKGKMVAKPEGDDAKKLIKKEPGLGEGDVKKLIKKEPGLGEGPVLMPDPRWFYRPRKFDRMLVGSSSCHRPMSREVVGEHAPVVIHKKQDISKMVDRMEVGSSRGRTSQPGLVIGERTPLLIRGKPQIRRRQESSYSHQSRAVEPRDVDWYSRLCSLEIPNKYKRFIKLACEEKLVARAVQGAKDPSTGSMCPCCGEDVETAMHCLWECSNAILVWSMSPLSSLVLLLLPSTFRELLCDAMIVLKDDYDLSLLVLICWYTWEARNGHEQEGTALEPEAIVKKALLLLGKKPSRRPPNFYTCFCRIL